MKWHWPAHVPPVNLNELVDLAIRGDGSLDNILGTALHGRFSSHDPVWPRESRAIWREAVRLYDLKVWGPEGRPESIDEPGTATGPRRIELVEWTWKGIIELAPERHRWWWLGGVSWADFGRKMGVPPTAAQYRYSLVDWGFQGPSGDRWIVQAPCPECTEVRSPYQIGVTLRCQSCR